MFSSSSKTALDSKFFLWTFPECPVRIHVSHLFIDRLRKAVLDLAPEDREVGGLLIGNELSPTGDIEVSDYLQLPPGSESNKNFRVCSDSLTQAIQSGRAADRRVVGFYRTHLEQRIQLRSQDLECIRSKFNDPMNVFLVIRPHDGRASAGFFFWEDGSVVGGLTFPFSSTELESPSWTTLVGGSPKPSRLHGLLARTRDRALPMSAGRRIGLVVLVATLLAFAAALRIYRPASDTSPTLGLRIERALLGVVVAWNPAAPEVATAKDADLLIWDGSSPPAFVRLTTAQLRTGRAFFTSVSDRVEVRLDIIGTAGRARTESIVSVAHPGDLVSPEPPATEASAPVRAKETSPPAPQASEKAKAAPVHAPVAAAPVQEAKGQQRPPAAQPENTAPTVAEEHAPVSFQTAVPIRERRPEIPYELRPLIQSDNVVEVQVRISALGKVTGAKLAAAKGPAAASLSQSALNAALGWQFRPATQNGQAVPSEKILEFLFRPSIP